MGRFEKYALKENPFDIFSYEHKMANREKEWNNITASLISAFEGRGPRYFVLLGDYGMGKTYMLEQIYNWLSEGEAKRDVFVVYTKGDVLYEKRLALLESEPKWAKFGLDLVMRIFANIDREKLIDVLQKANLKDFKSKFIKVFETLKSNKEVGFKYITGEKLGAKDFQQLGVDSSITDSQTSLALFFDFLRVIHRAGYNNFLVLIDEFEYLAAQGESKIIKILNTFREIFDDFGDYSRRYAEAIAKPHFMFATSPGGWDRLTELEVALTKKIGGAGIAPFMRRLSKRDMVALEPFTKEKTLELVELRLSEARMKELKDPLFPFTQKAIEHVHELSLYKPGNVIQYCGILLEDALNEGLEKIDEKGAKKILHKYGIYLAESESAKRSSKPS
ncbi:hypothetical protein ES706_02941 [subsurface metagenome]